MEAQKELTINNYHLLIPRILGNIEKLDFNHVDKYSIFNNLDRLPTPPEAELYYIFYDISFHYIISNYVKTNYEILSGKLDKWGLGKWYLESISGNFMSYYVLQAQKKDSNFLEKIYKESNSNFLLEFLSKNSIYSGTNWPDYLSERKDPTLQGIAILFCNLETAKRLTKSPYEKVRVKAYERLGPMEYLDEMLLDKSRRVRSIAAGMMPMGYRVPDKALSDRAYWSFTKILEKVSIDQVPMLLANKNFSKNKHLADLLQKRLDSKL